MKFLKSEPVLIVALLQAALVLAGAFGLHLSAEQITAVVGFFSAVLAVVIRQVVASPATVVAAVTDAATKTAEQLTTTTVGAVGNVTAAGEGVVTGVVGEVLNSVGGLVASANKGA